MWDLVCVGSGLGGLQSVGSSCCGGFSLLRIQSVRVSVLGEVQSVMSFMCKGPNLLGSVFGGLIC